MTVLLRLLRYGAWRGKYDIAPSTYVHILFNSSKN